MKALATYVDRLIEGKEAVVSESSAAAVTIHGLTEPSAARLLSLLKQANLGSRVVDSAEQDVGALELGVAPFSISFSKASAGDDGVRFVSTDAFQRWMQTPEAVGVVRVASCSSAFRTEGFVVAPWGDEVQESLATHRGDPAKLVRVIGGGARPLSDIRPLILSDDSIPWGDQAFNAWVRPSVLGAFRAIATEINGLERVFEFVGPPRLKIPWPEENEWVRLDLVGFRAIQGVVSWVYALPREAELRLRLFTQEFARLVVPGAKLLEALGVAALALEGAKIAYNFSLQEVTKDALKGFADLRKGVADDVQKLVESNKQLALSGAAALFYAIGLLAARVTTPSVPVWIVDCLAAIGLAYVSVVLFINFRYVRQQESLRPIWKEKLYRYLTEAEYKKMVEEPTSECERHLRWTMFAVLLLSIVVFGGVVIANHSLSTAVSAPPH